jgi:hypothetical protein
MEKAFIKRNYPLITRNRNKETLYILSRDNYIKVLPVRII